MIELPLPRIAIPLMLLGLSACGGGGEGSQAGNSNTAAPTQNGQVSSTKSANLWNGGQSRPLDVQVAHPSGAVLQLTSIQSRPTETAIGMRVINGRDRDVDLNRFSNNRAGYIILDTGERLYISPPAGNARLTIPAGQTFEGELIFLGRLPPVQSAILVLNENQSATSEYSTTPGFRINLPLAGKAAAGAAQ